MLCFGFGGVLLLCGVFVSSFASVWNPEFSAQLDLDDRQGFIASSAMQQKKKKVHMCAHAARSAEVNHHQVQSSDLGLR